MVVQSRSLKHTDPMSECGVCPTLPRRAQQPLFGDEEVGVSWSVWRAIDWLAQTAIEIPTQHRTAPLQASLAEFEESREGRGISTQKPLFADEEIGVSCRELHIRCRIAQTILRVPIQHRPESLRRALKQDKEVRERVEKAA